MTRFDGTASPSGGSSASGAEQQSIQSLETQHRDIFCRAVSNVLSCPIADVTYGQIIDGLPLSDVVRDTNDGYFCVGHPLRDERLELSSDVVEKTRQLRSSFDATQLKFDTQLLHSYQIAAPGSRAFQTILIELVAIAIHSIAAWLFKQEPILSPTNELVTWRPSERYEPYYPNGYPPTLFLHAWYQDYDQYPEGLADVVGYWAEARILGGVVLFDRRHLSSSTDTVSYDVYFHADRYDVTYRIFKLLDHQKQALVRFLLHVTPSESCPLPILGDMNNRERIDPEEPIESTGIYRDKWERKPLAKDSYDRRLKDVVDTFEYVTWEEWAAAKRRALYRRERLSWLE